MKLYFFRTPNSAKPCAVAKYLGSPVEMVHVDLTKGEQKSPDIVALNPNAKVPILTDGNVTVWESPAIMLHLAQKANSDLWPADAQAQVDVLKWLNWDTAHFSRHGGTLLFEHIVKPVFGWGDPDPDVVAEATGFFRQFAGVLNDHLKGRSFVSGDKLSLADFSIAAMLLMSEQGKFPLQEFGEITRWYNELSEIPAIRDPWPASS